MDSQGKAPQPHDDSKHLKQARHLPERLRPLPADDQLVVLWIAIEQGLAYCLQPGVESVSMQTHVTIYSAIHDYLMSHLHQSKKWTTGQEVYDLLNDCLIDYLRELRKEFNDVVGESLLRRYVSQWARWEKKAACICSVFIYLERWYINRERDEGKQDIHKLSALHMIRWKEEIFNHVNDEALNAVRELAERKSDGESGEDLDVQQFTDAVAKLYRWSVYDQQATKFI